MDALAPETSPSCVRYSRWQNAENSMCFVPSAASLFSAESCRCRICRAQARTRERRRETLILSTSPVFESRVETFSPKHSRARGPICGGLDWPPWREASSRPRAYRKGKHTGTCFACPCSPFRSPTRATTAELSVLCTAQRFEKATGPPHFKDQPGHGGLSWLEYCCT